MPLEDVLVAISKTDGNGPVGAGFLVDHRLVVTCAHVVNQALGRDEHEVTRPLEQEKVSVRFQTIASQPMSAWVAEGHDAWNPPPARRELGADFCLLRLERDPPGSIARAELGTGIDLTLRDFRTVGFPKDWDLDPATGHIVGLDQEFYVLRPSPASLATISTRVRSGWLSDQQRPPGLIYEGFSGAPVEVAGMIVGMLVESRQLISDATAYMLPVSAFPARLSQRARKISPDGAVPIRPAAPDSPRQALVTAYLKSIGGDADADLIHIRRTVLPEPEDSGSQSVPAGATVPATEPEAIDSALERAGKVVLLGEPGLGKSTALRYLERMVAARTLSDAFRSDASWIPILVELKTYRGEPELEALLAARINALLRKAQKSLSDDSAESTRIMKAWLKDQSYRFLILLDALDEVPSPFYGQLHDAIKTLLNYPHRFVLSCRIADYDQSLHEFTSPFVLVELQPDDIRHYLQETLGEKGTALFQEQLKSNAGMLALASNALLLKLMVEIVKQTPDVTLPRNKGQLFTKFVDAMPRRRRQEGFRVEVPPDIVATALARLGAEVLDRPGQKLTLGEVREWHIPCGGHDLEDVLLEAKKCRFLSSDGSVGNSIEFIHPLFIEYFAAAHLNAALKGSTPDYASVLDKRINHRRWREAIVMLAGISARPQGLVSWVATRLRVEAGVGSLYVQVERPSWLSRVLWWFRTTRVDLLLECWRTSSASGDPDTRNAVVDALRTVVRYSKQPLVAGVPSALRECAAALRALGEIGDERALPDLDRFIEQQAGRYRTAPNPSFSFLSGWFGPDVFELARRAADAIRQRAGKPG
jgi:Trypsin-like peptidase domain